MAVNFSYSYIWTNYSCQFCIRFSHKGSMALKSVVSTADETKAAELYVCARCGSSRAL